MVLPNILSSLELNTYKNFKIIKMDWYVFMPKNRLLTGKLFSLVQAFRIFFFKFSESRLCLLTLLSIISGTWRLQKKSKSKSKFSKLCMPKRPNTRSPKLTIRRLTLIYTTWCQKCEFYKSLFIEMGPLKHEILKL